MSEASKYSKQYTAEDIQQYLEGKMSPAEMYDMEKAALDDPFLADAIEGMQNTREAHGTTSFESNLQQLKKQLAEKTRESGKVIPFRANRWWQVAAAAIILVTGGVFAYNALFRDKVKDELAIFDNKNEQPATTPQAAKADSIISPVNENEENSSGEKAGNGDLAETKGKTQATQNKNAESADAAPPTVSTVKAKDEVPENNLNEDKAVAREVPAGKEATKTANAELDEAGKKDKAGKALDEVATKDEAAKPSTQRMVTPAAGNQNFFQGRVTDNNNKPVANATVQLNNQKQAVLTDDNGYFKLPSRDTTVQVLVNSIGFETKEFQLSNRIAYNEIRLEPSHSTMNEVEVVKPGNESKSAGARKSKPNYPKVMVQDAEPVMGWVEFERYLEKNKKPTVASGNGEVVVSFQVNRNGELSAYKVEQSLSSSQDAEAIRLIKEGPAWRLKQGRKARVMVIVRF